MLRWLGSRIDIEEACDWVHFTGANAYEAVSWRREGFALIRSSLWTNERSCVYPDRVWRLHLQLFGETHGIGPIRKYDKPYPSITPPQTREEEPE